MASARCRLFRLVQLGALLPAASAYIAALIELVGAAGGLHAGWQAGGGMFSIGRADDRLGCGSGGSAAGLLTGGVAGV